MPRIACLLVLGPLLWSCASTEHGRREDAPALAAPAVENPSTMEASRWFESTTGRAAGVALVLHGLNLRPGRMDALAELLASQGLDAFRAVLTGHEGDLAALKAATRDGWLGDVDAAYRIASQRARERKVPLYLVGFSLGALLAIDLMQTTPDVSFDRMVLFAPALTPKPFTRLTRLLSPLPSFVLPSLAPESYRVHGGTPIAAYMGLLDSANAVAVGTCQRWNIPTTVFIDPRDELVSLRGLEKLIAAKGLTRWTVLEVSNRGSQLEERRYHHLITDSNAVGTEQWAQIANRVRWQLQNREDDGP